MDTVKLRKGFKEYYQKRYPNDNHPDANVSMAFFLHRNERELGLNFQDILERGVIPDSYKIKLEKFFTEIDRKNPKLDSATYEWALRLLLEFVNNTDNEIKKSINSVEKATITVDKKNHLTNIPAPTEAEVLRYLCKWDNLSGYKAQEDALNLLFQKTFPLNRELSEVLLKCSVLNDFYGTNIYGIFPVAKHIVSLDIDSRLNSGDAHLVNDIAVGHGVLHKKTGKQYSFYSFASKYCSHHNGNGFPIFDSYVEKLLKYYRQKDGFFNFRNEDLRDYLTFKAAILAFQKAYSLESFTLKQIDQYLWQLGKEKFPNKY